VLVTCALSSRLVAIQVVGHEEYLALRDGQSCVKIPVAPERGRLLDRKGRELAVSRSRVKSLFAVPPQIERPDEVAEKLALLLRIDEAKVREGFAKRERRFVWVKRMLTDLEVREVGKLDWPGLGFRDEPKRFYPHGKLASHVLGFVGVDHSGLESAEAAFEFMLAGKPGHSWFARDAKKRLIALPGHRNIEPRDGNDVWLTLDTALQYAAEEELDWAMAEYAPLGGCVVMMDSETGGILALTVRPTFDPNRFGVSPNGARRNRVITDPYEPGSIFKPLTLAMAYEEKVVGPNDKFSCGGGAYTFRDGRRKRTLHDYHGYGRLTVEEILVKSSNIGITKIALKLGDARLQAWIERFGVGRKTGIELRGEEKGWYAPRGWSFYSRTSVPWGQEVSMTPLQILCAINVIANDGVWVKPRIFLRATAPDGSVAVPVSEREKKRLLSAETARLVRRGMTRVVDEGTGRRARVEGYKIGGKTGTKSKREKDGSYSKDRSITSFVCFAPSDRPRFTLLVSLDEPTKGAPPHKLTGGLCGASLAKRILERALKILGIPPEENDDGPEHGR